MELVNSALQAFRMLGGGNIDLTILEPPNGPHRSLEEIPTEEERSMIDFTCQRVQTFVDMGPETWPASDAALGRLNLVSSGGKQKKGYVPLRGEVWPMSVEAISLPKISDSAVDLRETSQSCRSHLSLDSMLVSQMNGESDEFEFINQVKGEIAAYDDPILESKTEQLKLALRLYQAGECSGHRSKRE